MTLIMRDSINGFLIPVDTPVVAGYKDGKWAWQPAMWNRFPNAVKLEIAVSANTEADVLDIENGDATPSEAAGWCDRFNRPNRRRPCLYCNRSSWDSVRSAVGNRMVDYWIATLDGKTKFVEGAVAVQYQDFGSYDESIIADSTWVYGTLDPQILDMVVKGWYRFPPMNRNPLQSEVDYWVGRIRGGENPEATMDIFMASQEYQQKLAELYSGKP